MSQLIYPPTQNALQKTLASQLDQGVTASATLNNTTGLQNKPGIMVIDRVDTNDTPTPSVREYVEFDGISGSTVTGLLRGIGGSSDQDHAVGAIVEFVFDITAMQRIIDGLVATVDATTGTLDTTKVVDLTTAQELQNKTHDGDFNLKNATDNIKVGASDPWMQISLPAEAWAPTTTSGCADATKVEAGTNDIDYNVLDFDTTTAERAFKNFQMPDNWDAGVIQFKYIWTVTGGSAAQTVEFELSGRSFANDDAIDQANGTAVGNSDTWIANGDIHESGWSTDVTLAGTPSAGEWVHLEIKRDTANDNLTGDARLIAVKIRYKVAQYGN